MASKTLVEILGEISAKILTGGRRTTAVNTRSVLADIADSTLNKKDGGLVVEQLTGYTTELTPTDPKHLATKKYVDDNSGDQHFKGTYANETALNTAYPTAEDGDYAYISTVGVDAVIWLWDIDDSAWVEGGTAGALTPDATTTIAGKSELIDDAELIVATPGDNSATTPSFINKVLDLRGVYNFWKRLFLYFIDRNSTQITVLCDNGGSGNAFTINGTPAFVGTYPYKLILTFSAVAGYVPTGAATIQVDAIGSKNLTRQDGTDLQSGDIVGGKRYIALYENSRYSLVGVGISGGSFTASSQAQAEAAASNTSVNSPTTLETTTGITPNRLWYFWQQAKTAPTFSDITASNATVSTPAFFDSAKKLISATGALLGTFWHTLTAKSTPVDADEMIVLDSANSFEAKKTTLTQFWSNFIRPKIESIVIFLEDFTSYSGGNYTFNGSGLSGSSSGFALNNATSSFSNYLIRNQKTQLLNYRDWIEFTVSGNGNGIQVGVYNGNNGLFLKLDCNAAGNRGQATIITLASGVSTVLGTSASNLSYTNGDVIRIELIRDDFNFRGIATNVTTSTQIVVSANLFVGDTNFSTVVSPASTLRNSNPCIMLLQGTMNVSKWKYEVPTTQRVEMVLMGDSITFGGNVTAYYKAYSRLVARNLTKDSSLIVAYPQATSADLLLIVPEILTIRPRYCTIMIGANDATASVAQATYNANVVSICNQLIAGGIIPVILTPLPMTSGTPNGFITSYTTGLNAMNGQYFVINTNATPNISTNLADGVHPTDLGHELIYRVIEADMVKYRMYSNTLPFNRSHLVDGTMVDKFSNQSAVANATAGVMYSSSDTDLTKQVYNNHASTTTAYKKKVVEKTTGEGFIYETPNLTNGSRALDVISGGDVNTAKIPFQFHTYHDAGQTALVMRENATTPLGFQSFSMLMQGAVLGEVLTYGSTYSDTAERLDMGIRAVTGNLRLIAPLAKKISFIFSNIGASSGEVAQFTPNKNILLGVTTEPTSAGTTIALANGILPTANNSGSGVSMTSISGVLNIRNNGGDVIILGSNSGWTALTGTSDKTTYATYSGTASALFVQAELQGVMDGLKKVTEHQRALIDALLATGLLKA